MSDQPANPMDPNQPMANSSVTPAPAAPDYVGSYAPPVSEPAAPVMPPMPATMSAAPAPVASAPAASAPVAATPVSQALEDQNIFHLLGVTDGTDEEKEAFLDELQQVIWEDFVENDVELLITEEEMAQFRQIMDQPGDEGQKQESMIVFLEKLIPDLEEIMLEKALELKEDMVRERIAGMRDYYANDQMALQKLDESERLVNADQWRQAADLLNSIGR